MIGFIGGGKMAEALIKGITLHGIKDILVSDFLEKRRSYLEATYNISVTALNKEVASTCNIIILAVKPQDIPLVLDEIAPDITQDKTVVSIAAGITIDFFQKKLATKKIIRVMPNTPVFVQEGMSIISVDNGVSGDDLAPVLDIFMSVGKVFILPEEHINAMATVSGCGPAFFAMFIEALTSAGVSMGLAKEQVVGALVQTMVGTAKMLQSGMAPENLREMVTSPGGMTFAGLTVFEEKKINNIVYHALLAARDRGIELGAK